MQVRSIQPSRCSMALVMVMTSRLAGSIPVCSQQTTHTLNKSLTGMLSAALP